MTADTSKIVKWIGPEECTAPEAPFAITDEGTISIFLGTVTVQGSSSEGFLRANRDGFRLLLLQRHTGLWFTVPFSPSAAFGTNTPDRSPRDLDELSWVLAACMIQPDERTDKLLQSLPFTAAEICQDIVSPRSERPAVYLPESVQWLRDRSDTLAYA